MMINCLGRRKMNDLLEIKILCSKVCLLLATASDGTAYQFNDILYRLCISDFVDSNGEMNNASVKNINSVLFYTIYLSHALSRLNAFGLIINDGGFVRKTFSSDLYYQRCIDSKNNSILAVIHQLSCTNKYCEDVESIEAKYKLLCEKYIEKKIKEEFE